MDLIATPEQEALRDVAADIAAELMPGHKFTEILDDPAGPQSVPLMWSRIIQLGLVGLSVPEQFGGAGVGLVEETILFEELGASLLPAPAFSTIALCLPLLTASGDAADLVPDVIEGSRRYALAAAEASSLSLLAGGYLAGEVRVDGPVGAPRLTGRRSWVLDAVGADGFLVPAVTPDGPAVYLVEAGPAAAVRDLPAVDASRPVSEVEFSASPAQLVLGPDRAAGALDAMSRTGAVLASAEAVGISRRVLTTTASYAATRTQFGRPIGAYQAVSHQLADTYVDVELARSLLLWAALDPVETAVLAAASRILPSAVRACERAIQLHGGIGMTWEAPVHRYYKRALLLHALLPRPDRLREALARTLLDD